MRARIPDRIVASAYIEDSDAMPTDFYKFTSLQVLELCSATHFHELSHGSSPPWEILAANLESIAQNLTLKPLGLGLKSILRANNLELNSRGLI